MGKGVKGSVTINGKQITAKTASQYTSYVAQVFFLSSFSNLMDPCCSVSGHGLLAL